MRRSKRSVASPSSALDGAERSATAPDHEAPRMLMRRCDEASGTHQGHLRSFRLRMW